MKGQRSNPLPFVFVQHARAQSAALPFSFRSR